MAAAARQVLPTAPIWDPCREGKRTAESALRAEGIARAGSSVAPRAPPPMPPAPCPSCWFSSRQAGRSSVNHKKCCYNHILVLKYDKAEMRTLASVSRDCVFVFLPPIVIHLQWKRSIIQVWFFSTYEEARSIGFSRLNIRLLSWDHTQALAICSDTQVSVLACIMLSALTRTQLCPGSISTVTAVSECLVAGLQAPWEEFIASFHYGILINIYHFCTYMIFRGLKKFILFFLSNFSER